MDYVKTIKDFIELKQKILDPEYIIGFDSDNGKRLILRFSDSKRCLPIGKNLEMVKLIGDPFEETPLDLLLGYFSHGDVSIKKLFFFSDKRKAIKWLFLESLK
jgi:hypothetical protein